MAGTVEPRILSEMPPLVHSDVIKSFCNVSVIHNTTEEENFHDLLSKDKNIYYILVKIDPLSIIETHLLSFHSKILYWIIIDENGHYLISLPRNYDVLTFGLLKRKIGIANMTVSLSGGKCNQEELHSYVRSFIWNLVQRSNSKRKYQICNRVSKEGNIHIDIAKYFIVTPTWKRYNIECFGIDDQNNTFSRTVKEGVYVFVVYWTVYVIIVFSPVLVLLLVDLMDLRNKRFNLYTEGDVPYSINRSFITFSKLLDVCMPNLGTLDRSLQKVCIVVWFVNLVIYCLNMWSHISVKTIELEMENIEIWSGSWVSKEIKILLFALSYTIAFVVFLVLIKHCKLRVSETVNNPPVYFINSTGKPSYFNLLKKSLHSFITLPDDEILKAGKTGRQLLLIQMERCFLLTSERFWSFLTKLSFSPLAKLKSYRLCISIPLFIPILLYCFLCIVVSLSLNLLWGLFPIFGFLFTSLSLVRGYCSLLKILIIAMLLHFFIQIVFGENLIFSLNVVLITSLIGVPETSSESFPFLSQVIPIVVYTIRYWNQFTRKYKDLLDITFKVKKEKLEQQSENTDTEQRSSEDEVVVSTKEFNLLCEHVIPIKEQSIRLFGKVVGTLLFLTISVTMLFWKKSSDFDFARIDKIALIVFVFLIPKLVEYCCGNSNEVQTNNLKVKVKTFLNRLENEDLTEQNNVEFSQEGKSVTCLWNSCCETEVIDDNNIHECKSLKNENHIV